MTAQDSTHPTGVANTGEVNRKGAARARERKANAALQMKLAGADWSEIAEVMGYPTPRHAVNAVELALERGLGDEESKAQMRHMAGKRLERLLRGVWAKAINPENPEHLNALTKAREIIAQHSKLYGLDAPTEVVVHNPTAAELEQWVSVVVAAQTPQIEEFDIFEGEVVEDEPQAIEG